MPKNDEGEFELVLGNRQLISVFLIVVVLLGVFFSMGYIVGRNLADGRVRKQPATTNQPAIRIRRTPRHRQYQSTEPSDADSAASRRPRDNRRRPEHTNRSKPTAARRRKTGAAPRKGGQAQAVSRTSPRPPLPTRSGPASPAASIGRW